MTTPSADLTTASIYRLAWLHWRQILRSWDLWAAALGALGTLLLHPKAATVVSYLTAVVGVASAIIGIVLAALAIVTAFLDREYGAALERAGHGVASEVFAFRYPAAIAVLSVVVSAAFLLAQDESWLADSIATAVAISTFLFLYTLFATLNLVAGIGGHLMNRSRHLAKR